MSIASSNEERKLLINVIINIILKWMEQVCNHVPPTLLFGNKPTRLHLKFDIDEAEKGPKTLPRSSSFLIFSTISLEC